MNKVLFAVCDDDQVVAEAIFQQVQAYLYKNSVDSDGDTFYSPESLLRKFSDKNYGLLFLDIDMPGLDGIQVAKKILDNGKQPVVIFVSNLESRVFETFSVQPFSFIRKNHFKEDFSHTMQNYIDTFIAKEMSLIIETNSQSRIQKLQINSIVLVECQRNVQLIYLVNSHEPLKVRMTMVALESELRDYDIIRVHKGYLVNMRYIKKMDKSGIELTDGHKVFASRGKVNQIKEQFAHYLRKTSSVLFEK